MYKVWLNENLKNCQRKMIQMDHECYLAAFSLIVYEAIYEISINDKFSYQIAKDFNFDRVLLSKEFSDDEKEKVQILEKNYLSIMRAFFEKVAI